MESLDKLQAELSGNVHGDAYDRLYNLTVDVSIEHAELMALAAKWIRKERLEPLEAENAKLRELCKAWREFAYDLFDEFIGEPEMDDDFMELDDRMRKMGVEP